MTGKARRIGRAVCLALATSGCNVVVHYSRSATEAEALVSEISRLGVRAAAVRADLRQPDQAEAVVGVAEERAGARIDAVIN